MRAKKLKKFWLGFQLIFFICLYSSVYTQSDNTQEILYKISENQVLFDTDPLKALKQTDELLKETIRLKDKKAELIVLSKRYEYNYLLKIDFEKMLDSAKELQEKARLYKNYLYEGISYKYMAQVYHFNELYDKAFEQLNNGEKVLDLADERDPFVILEKAKIHTMKANTYSLKGEYFNSIQPLFASLNEHKKLENEDIKRGAMFMDYANIGGAYLHVNIDSAEHYAQKSLDKMIKGEEDHNLTFLNYLVLGNVYKKRDDYHNTLIYYQKAESISENKHFVNIEELYRNMIDVYDSLGEGELKNQYEHKLKDLKIQVAQNQNKSLKKIVKENDIKKPVDDIKYFYILVTSGVVVFVVTFLILYFRRKKNKQNIITTTLQPDIYKELLKVLKNNDASFLLTFEKHYPGFSSKIININPEITTIEIELLAMLRLKLSTKEIAQYKFLQPKTINNRRHIIRKKLYLLPDADLYKWVETI